MTEPTAKPAPKIKYDGREPIPVREIQFVKEKPQNVPGKSGACSSVTWPIDVPEGQVWYELWFLPAIGAFAITTHDPRRPSSPDPFFVPREHVLQWKVRT